MQFIDLFCGIGGFRLALERLGLYCVFSSDIDKWARQTYHANFSDEPAGDITQIPAEDIPEHDLICAGFPCQAFSIAGKREGFADSRGTLFFEIIRLARHHQPAVLFLENVRNLVSHDKGRTFNTIMQELDSVGYDVFYQVLDSSRFGVPTSRHRVYLVCFRKNLGIDEFVFPSGSDQVPQLQEFLSRNGDRGKIIERTDITWRDLNVTPAPRPIRIGQISKGAQGARIYSPLGTAITFNGSGGGWGGATGLYLIDGQVRKLSVREAARIMGYPPNFIICGSKTQAYRQIGNSVVVPVIEHIAIQILRAVDKQKAEQYN